MNTLQWIVALVAMIAILFLGVYAPIAVVYIAVWVVAGLIAGYAVVVDMLANKGN
jgi:hypothetical protein